MPKEKVGRVIDGDTFVTERGSRIRLNDVDTPEQGAPNSRKATNELEKLIDDKAVSITTVAKDRYGRRVADVKVDGIDVNKRMKKYDK